jgi:non-ribosomal peptide synthetase component F
MTSSTHAFVPEATPLASSPSHSWSTRFDGPIRAVGVRPRSPRPPGEWPKTAGAPLPIGQDSLAALTTITRGEPFLTCAAVVAAISVCLSRESGVPVIAVGCPALIGDRPTSLGGHVVVVANEIRPEMTFRQLLQNVRQTMLEAHKRQRDPLDQVLLDLGLDTSRERCALFDVGVSFAGHHEPVPEVGQGLTVNLSQERGELTGEIRYSPVLFEAVTVERFCHHVSAVLQSGLQHVDRTLADIDIVSEGDQHLLATWNGTLRPSGHDRCVHELF